MQMSPVQRQVLYNTGLWQASLRFGRSNLALPGVVLSLLHPMSLLTG